MGHLALTEDEAKVKRWARTLMFNPDMQDDAESIAHFTILQCRESWDGRIPYGAFIRSRVRFAVVDEVRAWTHRGQNLTDPVDPQEMRGFDWSTLDADPLTRMAIEQALAEMTDRERTIVYGLAEGKLKQEIAEELGVTNGRVSQLLEGVRVKLNRQLEVVA